jgi:hypothetical protein
MKTSPDKILLPTAYFGPVEYFYYLNKYEQAVIEIDETWPKQTYRNRTLIVTDKGKQALTVPVTKPLGNRSKTKDITIFYDEHWPQKHWRAIETAYSNSPYFLYYSDEIREALFVETEFLIEKNDRLTDLICRLLGIDCNISYSETFQKTPTKEYMDLRYKITPKQPSTLDHFPPYIQVFSDKQPFVPNAGILDLLFCLGPEAKNYLDQL